MVIKYLDDNFTMTFESYYIGKVIDNYTKKGILVTELSIIINTVFSLGEKESLIIAMKWWDEKEIPFIKQETEGSSYVKPIWI